MVFRSHLMNRQSEYIKQHIVYNSTFLVCVHLEITERSNSDKLICAHKVYIHI